MRKKNSAVLAAALLGILLFTANSNALLMSSDDLWDVSNGTTVTLSSRLNDASDSRGMFGGSFGLQPEPANTIFYDESTGFVHWIEWQTLTPVTITNFNLVAAHDSGGGRDARERGFSRFTLYAWSGDEWESLYEYYPSNPYGGGENYTTNNFLELYASVTETTAQNFRAEFVQYGDRTSGAKGPRILELDGYYVPEPATMALLGLGVLALRRKK